MSTFGFLQPVDIGGEVNDLALNVFLQNMVVGITGLPGTMVRPRWQPVPPNQPDLTTNWGAIGVVRKERDTFEFEGHIASTEDSPSKSIVVRQQVLSVISSFYGPAADSNGERMAMGLGLSTNRQFLTKNGYGLIGVGDTLIVPAKINDQWVFGVDLDFQVSRRQSYTYAVQEITSAGLVIHIDDPIKDYTITVQPPA